MKIYCQENLVGVIGYSILVDLEKKLDLQIIDKSLDFKIKQTDFTINDINFKIKISGFL